jgi:hypothetical protein
MVVAAAAGAASPATGDGADGFLSGGLGRTAVF